MAVVGGGIVGLALAYASARRGLKVGLFERNPRALGATIRNFGMVWPIGQPEATFERALRARSIWLDLAERAGFWAKSCGSLHLAYHADELQVLEEFAASRNHGDRKLEMLTPEQTVERSPVVRPVGLAGSMFSPTEVNIDPREATLALHRYLSEVMQVEMHYNTAITHVEEGALYSGDKAWRAERVFVCSGAELETLFPGIMAGSGLVRCKLQMMRTVPQPKNFELGPNLAAGLTLLHYASFAHCAGLGPLRARMERDLAPWLEYGIHVMVSQTSQGELTLGDSHEYGPDPDPFCRAEINNLILDYLRKFARFPNETISQTWQGVYAKLPGQTEFLACPQAGVWIVNGLGGAGMTLSFGLAEDIFEERVKAGKSFV